MNFHRKHLEKILGEAHLLNFFPENDCEFINDILYVDHEKFYEDLYHEIVPDTSKY